MTFRNQTINLLDFNLKSLQNNRQSQKCIEPSEKGQTLQRYLSDHQNLGHRINSPSYFYNKDNTTPSLKSRSSAQSIYVYDQVFNKQNLKKILAEEYKSIINSQKEKKQIQRKRELQLEREILQNQAQNERKRKFLNLQKEANTKNIFLQHYSKSQQLKITQKKYQIQQKNAFRQNLQKKLNILPFRDPSEHKKNLFKEFFNNYYKESFINDKMYLEQVRPNQRRRQQQIQKLTYGRLDRRNQKYKKLQEQKKQEQIKKKEQLKQILKSQINQKQQMRRNYSQNKLNNDRLNNQFDGNKANYYDTINNPVNLGLDPENKYIINHIRKSINENPEKYSKLEQKDRSDRQSINKMSRLARSGSQIFF